MRGKNSILAGAVLVVLLGVVALLAIRERTELEQTNEDARRALAEIAVHRDDYQAARRRLRDQEARIGTGPPQLAADLEAASRVAGFVIPQTEPRPTVPAGRRYLEHSVGVTLRRVDLLSLAKFLSALETGPRPIFVTQLRVQGGFAEIDRIDVTLTATTYQRIERPPARPVVASARPART